MSVLSSYVHRSTQKLKEVLSSSIRAKLSISRENIGENVTPDEDRRDTPKRRHVETHSVLFHIKTVINEARDMAYEANEAVIIIEHDFVNEDRHLYSRGLIFGPASYWRQQVNTNHNKFESLTQSFFLALRPLVDLNGNVTLEIAKGFFPGLIEQETRDTSGGVLRAPSVQAVFHKFDSVFE